MKNKKIILCGLLLILCVVFAGCGEKLYSLTDEEAEAIASYSAKVVAKYNKNQDNGLCYVSPQEEKEEPKDTQETTGDVPGPQEVTPEEGTPTQMVSMTDAMGIAGVTFSYTGYEVLSDYQSSDYFVLTPNAGYSYLVFHFDGWNTSDQEMMVDILSKNPVFRATVNNSDTASAETTILLNDLSTFQGNLAPQTGESFVLLFQFKKELLSNVSSVTLQMKNNQMTYDIALQ